MEKESYVVKMNIYKDSLWEKARPVLNWLDMELTERCNNNCIHCCINLPANDASAKKRELSTEEIKRILKEAASLGCITVRFTGGEPLLREDFQEIYIFTRKLGLTVLIFTNATLINSRLAELFVRIPPLEKIEVTLYGMKKSSYESVTQKAGSFSAAWRGIRLLLEKKVPFVVKNALLPSNKDEMPEFEKWAKTIPGMDLRPVYAIFFDLHCRRDPKKNESITKLRPSPEEGFELFARPQEEYIKEMKEYCRNCMHPTGDELFSCGSGKASGCVDAYGIFQSCMMLRGPGMVYNLKNGTLKEALTDFFPRIRKLKATNPAYLDSCAKCFLRGLCEQCPGRSWVEHGNLDTPVDYLCRVAHVQARFLGLVKKNEMGWEVKDWEERIRGFTG